jgi:hypothetical protein
MDSALTVLLSYVVAALMCVIVMRLVTTLVSFVQRPVPQAAVLAGVLNVPFVATGCTFHVHCGHLGCGLEVIY